jgi:hypothetical protein
MFYTYSFLTECIIKITFRIICDKIYQKKVTIYSRTRLLKLIRYIFVIVSVVHNMNIILMFFYLVEK